MGAKTWMLVYADGDARAALGKQPSPDIDASHPALAAEEDPASYPFPFHPLELGEAALQAMFGYQLEGYLDASLLEPESIPLIRLKRSRSWWKFWR